MTTRRPLKTPKTPPADRPADPDPLPDPSRVPDMQQNKHVARTAEALLENERLREQLRHLQTES